MKQSIIIILGIMFISALFLTGCAKEVVLEEDFNDTNISEPVEEVLVIEELEEFEESEETFLHMDKCSKEDVFGIFLQYKGCTQDDDFNIAVSLANLGYLDMEDFWIFIVDGVNDTIVDRLRLSEVNPEYGVTYLQPKEDVSIEFSLYDLENQYDMQIKRLYLVPEVILNNNESATCLNYRIGFKPYDCKRSTR